MSKQRLIVEGFLKAVPGHAAPVVSIKLHEKFESSPGVEVDGKHQLGKILYPISEFVILCGDLRSYRKWVGNGIFKAISSGDYMIIL